MKTLLLITLLSIETPVAGFAYVDDLQPHTAIQQEIDEEKVINNAIIGYSLAYDVDPDLVRAVIYGESDGDIEAYNRNDDGTHDTGLMQINSFNHEWLKKDLGITDFKDPRQNIQCGTYMLSLPSHKYLDLHKILMSYNMGEKRMKELFAEGITSSAYSRKVVKKLNEIKEERK